MRSVAIAAVILAVPSTLRGATYTVKAGGGGNYTTIQACANAAVAGDTCSVDPGTYNERVTPARSGSAGQPIRFQASTSTRPKVRAWTLDTRSYITVTGFEITNNGMSTDSGASVVLDGSDHVRIVDNYIHDTTFIALRSNASPTSRKSSYLYIGGNTITAVGPPNSGPPDYTGGRTRAMQLWTDYALIENNDISHTADAVQSYGHYNVLRNNVYHDNYVSETQGYNGTSGSGDHIDFWQSFCNGAIPAPEAANYTLLEGNYEYGSPDLNSHFALINGTDSCGGTTTIIVRHNVARNIGSSFYVADTNSQSSADHHKVYNNTVATLVNPADHNASTLSGVTAGTFLNNIIYDAGVNSLPYQGYVLKSADTSSSGDYNLGFFSSGTKTWSAPINSETHHVLNLDPLFVTSTDFHLQVGSPARNAGGALTSVATGDSGTGTSLVMTDAHFFQDGWAGVNADWIRVGPAATVQISAINYATNVITLTSSIARSSGDPVYLYKDSSGKVVLSGSTPDIGAYSYAPSAPVPPTNLTAITH